MRFKPRRSSPRLHSFGYQGSHAYHLTLTTRSRLPRFQDGGLVASCLECLAVSASRYGFEVVAYCFMLDHLHLLVVGNEGAPLVRLVQHFKQATGYRHRGLWQRSYYDHILRREESLQDVARYMWENPVRAGIVENMADYPYSGPRELMAPDRDSRLPVKDRAEAKDRAEVKGRAEVKDRAEALSLRSDNLRNSP